MAFNCSVSSARHTLSLELGGAGSHLSSRSRGSRRLSETLNIVAVLVCPGCYNKMPGIGWLISSGNFLVAVLEVGSLRIGCQRGRVRVTVLLRSQTSCVASLGGRAELAL